MRNDTIKIQRGDAWSDQLLAKRKFSFLSDTPVPATLPLPRMDMRRTAKKLCPSVLLPLLMLGLGCCPAFAEERIFVLQDQTHILQYRMDNEGLVSLVRTYSDKDLPQMFPAESIDIKSGNILCTYGKQRNLVGRSLYDPAANGLMAYQGNPGEPSNLTGRILEKPPLEEIFRGDGSLYSKTKASSYRESLMLEEFRKTAGMNYQDLFVLDGQVFGITGDHIDRLSRKDGTSIAGAPEKALTLPGANLVAAAVSPWNEVFISDSAKNSLQRVLWRNSAFESNGSISSFQSRYAETSLVSPGGLKFSADGDLFVVNRAKGSLGVLRFQFVLNNFVNWQAIAKGGIDLGGVGALDVALARPVGFVISEKTNPIEKLSTAAGGGHYGISQTIFVYPVAPRTNSEAAVLALVQYEPGGHTPVHQHPTMEQMEIVLEGKALWEVGEFEREVGPGDVIFCPRNVKHGYKVLGNTPFKFYQVEWDVSKMKK